VDREQKFHDPFAIHEPSCGPELPHDTAEDVFLDARARVEIPLQLVGFSDLLNWWSLRVFHEFFRDWQEQEHGERSVTTGNEAAIRLLHALQNSHDRKTAMRAECYLALINRKEESQTTIAAKYGVTKAAISKIIVQIKDELGLVPARHMKSESARESYRERALKIHKQNKEELCKHQTPNSFSRLSTLRSALMQKLAPSS
jgi:predicted transcriptional regulator